MTDRHISGRCADRGSGPCTRYGYPGVSFVAGDSATRVNDGFTRSRGPVTTVRLVPGAAAKAGIGLRNVDNCPVADCKPVPVRGFRVYPPDETASALVSQPPRAGSVNGRGVGAVLPVTR